MIIETISPKKIWDWLMSIWARSLIALVMLLVGLSIGEINAESRIVSDCKFAGAFRVGIQAFACQRKI